MENMSQGKHYVCISFLLFLISFFVLFTSCCHDDIPIVLNLMVMGKMRNCGMRKVKCGIKNAEWRWLVEATNHVTAGFPHITTPVCQPTVR